MHEPRQEARPQAPHYRRCISTGAASRKGSWGGNLTVVVGLGTRFLAGGEA